MISQFYVSRRIFSTVLSKSKTMNMNKCYFRYVERENKVDISFLLDIKGSPRQFNFSRNPTENLQVLISRIKTNVQKVVQKSNKKKKSAEDNEDFIVQLFDNKNNVIDDNNSCIELFKMDAVRLKMLNNLYEVVFNPPWVLNVSLPQSILAGFPVYPEYLEIQYAKLPNCIFNWYRGTAFNDKGNALPEQNVIWELTAKKYVYTPNTDDIGLKLKLECIPGNDDMYGPAVAAISKNCIEAGPGKCPFETRHLFCQQKLKDKSFRCVSYNILADLYCDSDYTRTVLHPYCPPYALHIDYRKQLVIKELLGYNGDILCLQEVDRKIFHHCLKPILDTEGMEGAFYKKAKEVAEGLACFYRKDRFKFLGEESIVLSEAVKTMSCLKPIWEKIKDRSAFVERLLDRSTISSATFLQSVDNPNEILIVANTHLYFHPDSDHIRLTQGGIVIYWLMELQKQIIAKNPGNRISVILCGDFNSVPACGIFKLYTTGEAPSVIPDWSSNADEAVTGLSLKQNISLGSACGTPTFTNFTAEFQDCLDYIYYDKSNLEVEQYWVDYKAKLKKRAAALRSSQRRTGGGPSSEQPLTEIEKKFLQILGEDFGQGLTGVRVEPFPEVVPLPTVEELKLHTALPSVVFPSDHIALIADLRFK